MEGDNIVFEGSVTVANSPSPSLMELILAPGLASSVPALEPFSDEVVAVLTGKKDGETVADSPFKIREEVEHPFRAVKVTKENLREIAGHVLRSLGGKVEVHEDLIEPYFEYGYRQVLAGQWLVEEWDFNLDEPSFHVATTSERKLHNLR